MSEKRRVVITGLGLISPLGIGVEASWTAAIAGKVGIGPITQFDASSYPVRIAGEVKDFDPAQYIDAKEIKKMDRFIHFAMAASMMASEDSGFRITPDNAERVGVFIIRLCLKKVTAGFRLFSSLWSASIWHREMYLFISAQRGPMRQ
jgi:3-oxoacyl-[acyl-carrier-protein] synthase II